MGLFDFRKLKRSTREQEENFASAMEESDVGAKDTFAMIISGFLVIVLPCLLILLAMAGVMLLLFGAFS